MKKKLILVALLITLVSISCFSWGIGASVGLDALGGLPGTSVMMSAKFDQLPFLMGLGFAIGQDTFSFGFTADYWMLNQNLFSFINVYVGPGLYLGYNQSLQIGGRIPVGLNVFPVKWLEGFVELAPTLSIRLSDPVQFPVFGLQGAIGARFWFK